MIFLENLHIENSGSISELTVPFKRNEDGTPRPLILVGENGSGKTTVLSFVVDALLQLASSKLNDVLTTSDGGTLFYRLRSADIKLGAESAVTHAILRHGEETMHYLDRIDPKTSEESLAALRTRLELPATMRLNKDSHTDKTWSSGTGDIVNTLASGAYVFFPSGRSEIPHWLQPESIRREHYTTKQFFGNNLNKPVVVDSAALDTANWIMDSLLDSAAGYQNNGLTIANELIKIILEDIGAHFAVGQRGIWPRLQIYTNAPVAVSFSPVQRPARIPKIPSLAHLSAGQAMLLSTFGTIANHGTLRQPQPLQNIEGIVIIDEIELYLHTHLQRSVLPILLKKFPKIQFILTTHSPSFIIGMKDHYGSGKFDILSLPTGQLIDANQFGEISAAVDALRETTAFKDAVKAEISAQQDGPILVVEGRSDSIFIENLWRHTYGIGAPFKILEAKGRRALRYLLEDEGFIEEIGDEQRVLALFDFDEAFDDWHGCKNKYPIDSGEDTAGLLKRHAEKQIFAGLLPVPAFRSAQAKKEYAAKSQFTIELYLPDAVLLEENNLEEETFPGDFQVKKFRGKKVGFAERVAPRQELAPHFDILLNFIKTVLNV